MKLACIADAHLGSREDDIQAFIRHLQLLKEEGIDHLVLLGDIFHYYIGFPSWRNLFPEEILSALESITASSVKTIYLEGNRDFFIDTSPLANAVSRVRQSVNLTFPSGTVHLEHGDLVNRKDRRYRGWRRFSKSWVIRLLLHLFPPSVLRPFVDRTESKLKTTNVEYKRVLPEEEFARFVRELPDANLVIIGHFHEHAEREIDGRKLIVMPAWLDLRSALLLEDIHTRSWHELS